MKALLRTASASLASLAVGAQMALADIAPGGPDLSTDCTLNGETVDCAQLQEMAGPFLAAGLGKSRLVAHIIREFRIDPYQILTIGDQGAWPGNDSALLEHKFSLSVDVPSRRLDRGWKLAPSHKRDVDATIWYLERMVISGDGMFRLDLTSPLEQQGGLVHA